MLLDRGGLHTLRPAAVTEVRTGRRGRPKKQFNYEVISEAFSSKRRITIKAYAKAINVHRNTLSNYLAEVGIAPKYEDMSDGEIDDLVRDFRKDRPDSGLGYLAGYIRLHGLRIQRKRIRASMRRVNSPGLLLRRRVAIRRRTYRVQGPNAVWHVDGHLKLIQYGIVIHIFAEGFSRLVSWI